MRNVVLPENTKHFFASSQRQGGIGDGMDQTRPWMFFGDFVRLHILFHAARNPVGVFELTEELNRHGYRFKVSRLDRVLIALERAGYLTASATPGPDRQTKLYRTTAKGRDFMLAARVKLQKLAEEILP
jgi:DNA-binding PadR family transcriptional regulator